jgi:hypothetical protein
MEDAMRSAFDECHSFLHSLHQQVDKQHLRSTDMYAEQNGKVNRLSEVANKTLDQIDGVKDTIGKVGTVLSCLVEFGSLNTAIN